MATITKIHGKTGLSFKITVHCGYDEYYRKRRHYKTYRLRQLGQSSMPSGRRSA